MGEEEGLVVVDRHRDVRISLRQAQRVQPTPMGNVRLHLGSFGRAEEDQSFAIPPARRADRAQSLGIRGVERVVGSNRQPERLVQQLEHHIRRHGRVVLRHLTPEGDELRPSSHWIRHELREMMQSGAIGEIVSVQHMEPIEHVHMSHSYVRGNWHDRNATTPIILAKSCHDLDILRWMVGKPCKKIVAMGGIKWFKKENAPAGSTPRCMDGCAVESTCPYSAMKIYYRQRGWTYVLDLPEEKEKQGDVILEKLRTTNYGRFVYQMDNNQEDHYVATMEFEGGVTAAFSMEAFTSYAGRRTRVMGSMGDIVGDMDTFTLTDFRTGKTTVHDSSSGDGHGGGDWRLVRNWLQAVSQRKPELLTSTIDASIESHVMGFMAEKSRKTGKIEGVRV